LHKFRDKIIRAKWCSLLKLAQIIHISSRAERQQKFSSKMKLLSNKVSTTAATDNDRNNKREEIFKHTTSTRDAEM
jgi:hypothetical protein